MKTCKDCGEQKDQAEFYGIQGECKSCTKLRAKIRNASKPADERKGYELHRQRFSFRRMFKHRYSAMKSRVEGRAIKHHPVEGMAIMTPEEFLQWCGEPKNMKVFKRLHKLWVASGFERKLTPSIDRIRKTEGYVLGNIQWLSLSENVKKDIDKNALRKMPKDPTTGQFLKRKINK